MRAFRYWLISLLLNEDEKCVLNQGINEVRHLAKIDLVNGVICMSDFIEDTDLIDSLNGIVKNDLWI